MFQVCALLALFSFAFGHCPPTGTLYYEFDAPSGDVWGFNFSHACVESFDFFVEDASSGHEYFAAIGKDAKHSCYPADWQPTLNHGAVVQYWGSTPDCIAKCTDETTGASVCCTKDCEVLGSGDPQFELLDTADPAAGGIAMHYAGVACSDSDPNWCDYDEQTGKMYDRTVSLIFECAPAVPFVLPTGVKVSPSNSCAFELHFKSTLGCGRKV